MLVFAERGKPEYPEKNLSEQQTQPTKGTLSLGIEPGTHWSKASALTTAPTLLCTVYRAGKISIYDNSDHHKLHILPPLYTRKIDTKL